MKALFRFTVDGTEWVTMLDIPGMDKNSIDKAFSEFAKENIKEGADIQIVDICVDPYNTMSFKETIDACNITNLDALIGGKRVTLTEDMEWSLLCDVMGDPDSYQTYQDMQKAGICTTLYKNTINETVAVKKGVSGVIEVEYYTSRNTGKPAAEIYLNINGVRVDVDPEFMEAEF